MTGRGARRRIPIRRLTPAAVLCAALMLSGASPCLGQEPSTEGLVGYWSFDEFRGHVAPDGSGQGNDALVRAARQVKGVRNTALEFDGVSSAAICPPRLGGEGAHALTLEAWVKPGTASFGGFPTVVRRDGSYALRFSDRTIGFLLWFEGKVVYLSSAPREWSTEQWYHLVGTYDGERMRLFVDGEEDGNSPLERAGTIDGTLSNCGIGGSSGGGFLQGVIDEVRIYHRALSPEEIRAAHAYGRESLRAQQNVAVEPKPVGEARPVFRKPERQIAMVQDGFIWVDAEDFTDYGGWSLDTQFVHLMGSGYLIAASVGEPVRDATLEFDLPKAGRYRLWVRAKNWIPEHSPGRFRVVINDRVSEKVFGAAETGDWVWEAGGEYDLEQGRVQLALRDLTGYFGRCDALVLTADLGYTPPAKVEEIQRERSRLTGLSLREKPAGEYDVIVVGAGAAGCCAALAAARTGARTALIQNRPVLGGNASDECGVGINGAASAHPNARESGIIEEVGRIKARFGYGRMSEPFRLATEAQENLSVFLNQHVFAVEMRSENVIGAVKAVDTLTGEVSVYRGSMFVDCTGDGWVGYYAGATFRLGRESREEFGESLAPEKADNITMSGCIMGKRALSYRAVDTGKPVQYTPPPWAPRFGSAEEFGRNPRGFAGGEWWLEHPGDLDDIWDAERARDELIRISFGYWDYIKNAWPERERAANYALAIIPIVDAKRESRRLIGDYILTQNDIERAEMFPDRVAHGGWPLDVHHPKGIYSGKEGPYHCTPWVPVYSIPYRCLYSVNIDNLLFAGRDVSVSHMALGSVRVQGTLAALGQAAGTAAALALQHQTTPRGIYDKHLTELQQRLVKDDQYIPGLGNEDPLDLARKAKVSASSVAEYEEFTREQFQKGDLHPLNMPRAVMFPVGVQRPIKSVDLLLASDRAAPTTVALHLRAAAQTGDFSSTEDLAVVETTVPAKGESWVNFALDREVASPFAWVWLEPADGVSWRLMETAPLGSCRAYGGEGRWTVVKGQYYAFLTDPAVATKADYRAENIINGVTRVVGTMPNLWASDPAQPLPQWVDLAFDTPTTINTVYLIFDTDMNAPYHNVPLVPQCVRDYELSYHDGAKWASLAEVQGNFQRRRVHRFEPVEATRLRLTIHTTNGSKSARVFEVRAYNE